MNFLPKDIEDIIIDYKNQLERYEEHNKKFRKTLDQIDYMIYNIIKNKSNISYTIRYLNMRKTFYYYDSDKNHFFHYNSDYGL